MSRTARLASAAVERGVEYLLGLVSDGGWRGFPTLAGESSTWVTAFVVAHTASRAPRAAVRAAQLALVESRSPGGGWSYGEDVPPDADSTAWCLIALRGQRALSAKARREASEFLLSHRTVGGFATYGSDSPIRAYVEAGDAALEGWTSAHPDVTAAALLAGVPRRGSRDAEIELQDLVARQTAAAFIESYWWRGPHYATALTLRALAERDRRLTDAKGRLLLRAMKREQLADGGYALGAVDSLDPFTTALALESLCHLAYLGGARERRSAAAGLLAAQGADGGWPGNFVMRIPAPGVTNPRQVSSWSRVGGGGNSYILDRDGLFATALSCHALSAWQSLEAREGREDPRSRTPVEAPAAPYGEDVIEMPVLG